MDYNAIVNNICDAAWNTRNISSKNYAALERSLAVLDGATRVRALSTIGSVLAHGIVIDGLAPESKESDRDHDPFTD